MIRLMITLVLVVATSSIASAHGVLVPKDKDLPPLAMVNHRVDVRMEDQVAITQIEQTFRNHTDRQLEATYLFPVPKGASVNQFTMWIDGKEVSGELLEAAKARQIYTDIVRRTQDPGLLEYMDNNVFRLRVFPILPKVDQKIALRFTAIAQRDAGIVEYVYPLKTDGKMNRTLEDFSIKVAVKSQHPIQSIYSPTHAITVKRNSDREASIQFERNQAILDKDFQLFYSVSDEAIGMTPLLYRPISSEDGYFLILVSPQIEAANKRTVPRDVVFVLDTSGSMDGVKMDQARKAVKYCLNNLGSDDRFAVVSFATNVRKYRDQLMEPNQEHRQFAEKWINDLRPGGGTAIQPALETAMSMRSSDPNRSFTVIFFTDGQPTIGELKPENILKKVTSQSSDNTRIFTFGVGDDVNTAMLDQIAEQTRAVSTYVRPAEDIETKVSSLYNKISHPILANVKWSVSDNIQVHELYPTQIPDLFLGQQLVMMGRYSGQGSAAIKLSGTVGNQPRELAYDITFPTKTEDNREFVEHLWARRKVGFLLDQIRANGEKKELMDELMVLAKKYGIATPYTSYLIVPDAPMPVVRPFPPRHPRPELPLPSGGPMPMVLQPAGPSAPVTKVQEFAQRNQPSPGIAPGNRGQLTIDQFEAEGKKLEGATGDERARRVVEAFRQAKDAKENFDRAQSNLQKGQLREVQTGRDGVELAIVANNLRQQERLTQSAIKNVNGRNCLDFGGVWIDEQFDAKMKTVVVKAQSDAYFRILEKQSKMRDVYQLGNFVVWVTPSRVALVIDANNGTEQLDDASIDALFRSAN